MIVLPDIFSNEDIEKQVMNWVKETFEELEEKLELKTILATAAYDSLPDLKTPDVLSFDVFQTYKASVNDAHKEIYKEFFTKVKARLEKKFTSEFSDSIDILEAILQDDTLQAFYASYLDKISKNSLKESNLIPNKLGSALPEKRKKIYDDLREGKASVQEICDKNGYTIETFGLKNFSPNSTQEAQIVVDKKGNPVLDKKTGLPITKVPKKQAPIQKTQDVLKYLDKILNAKFLSLDFDSQVEEAKRFLRIIYSNKFLSENLKDSNTQRDAMGSALENALWADLEAEEAIFIKDNKEAKTSHPFEGIRKKVEGELKRMKEIAGEHKIKVVSYFVPALDKRADADFMNALLNEKEVRFCEAKSSLTFGNLDFTPPGEYFSNLEQIASFLITRGGGILVLQKPMFIGKFTRMVREILNQEIGEEASSHLLRNFQIVYQAS